MKRLVILGLLVAGPAMAVPMPVHTETGTYTCPDTDAVWTDDKGVPHSQNIHTGETHECTKVSD